MAIKTLSKTFSVMKTNIGNQVGDTSTSLATKIENWLNDKYQDAWNRCMWVSTMNNDYTFETVVDQAEYDLPLDFSEELFMANIAQGYRIKRMLVNQWWRERYGAYKSDTVDSGTTSRYIILEEATNAAGTGFGKIRLDPPPDTAETFAMPYKRRFMRLVGATDTCTTDTLNTIVASGATFITDGMEAGMIVKNTTDNTYGIVASVDSETQLTMETDLCPDGDEVIMTSPYITIANLDFILEYGAIAEAWSYKRQFQKAAYFNQKFEGALHDRISQERSKLNQSYQFIPQNKEEYAQRPMTGWSSYDSIEL